MYYITLSNNTLKATNNIAPQFPKHLFWDMDNNKLSQKRDKNIIIPRMLMATNEETFNKDISFVESIYSIEDIYNVLRNTKERISNQVCRMVVKRYNKPTFLRHKF